MQVTSRFARKLAALERLGFALDPDGAAPEGACAEPARDVFRVVDRRPAMSTLVTIIALDGSLDRAEEAIGRALAEMDRLIGICSTAATQHRRWPCSTGRAVSTARRPSSRAW